MAESLREQIDAALGEEGAAQTTLPEGQQTAQATAATEGLSQQGQGSPAQDTTEPQQPPAPSSAPSGEAATAGPGQTASAAPATTQGEQQQAPPASSLLQYFYQRYTNGQDLRLENEQQLVDLLVQQYENIRQQYDQLVSQLQGQQQTEPQATEQQEPEQKPLNDFFAPLPQLPQGIENLVQLDPNTGRYVPVEGSNAWDLAQKANEYIAARQRKLDLLLNNPEEALKPFVEKVAEEVASRIIGQYDAQNHYSRDLEEFVDQFVQRDADGNPIVDATGKKLLTPEGEIAVGLMDKLMSGEIDQLEAFKTLATVLAQVMKYNNQGQQGAGTPPATQQAPAQVAEQRRQEFLSRTRQPTASAATPVGQQGNNQTGPVQTGPAALRSMLEEALADVPE